MAPGARSSRRQASAHLGRRPARNAAERDFARLETRVLALRLVVDEILAALRAVKGRW
jgi:hypothetical protein